MINEPHVNQLASGQVIEFLSVDFEGDDLNFSERYANTIKVRAPLPETLSLSVQNEVNQMFSVFQVKSDILQYLGGGMGKNFDRGYSQREFWRGPENADITVELHFNAYYSGYIDVMKPTQDLLLLGASRESSFNGGEEGVLWLGLDEFWSAPPKVILKFGDYFTHNNMIIKNVEVSYGNKLDNEFNPMSAVASVTMVPTDPMGFASMFGGSRYGGGLNTKRYYDDE